MTRGGTRHRATRKPVIVVAGEDRNDRESLRILLHDLCPATHGRIVEINDAARLRDAGSATLAGRAEALARKVRARAAREEAELACVFVQEDLDRLDGDEYDRTRARVQAALDAVFPSAHYVLPVWELEAWLLLFPDALDSLVAKWQVPRQYRNVNTGMLRDPKAVLMGAVSGTGRPYRESDAPAVFQKAVDLHLLDRPQGTNRSWRQFRDDVDGCCREHLPGMRG